MRVRGLEEGGCPWVRAVRGVKWHRLEAFRREREGAWGLGWTAGPPVGIDGMESKASVARGWAGGEVAALVVEAGPLVRGRAQAELLEAGQGVAGGPQR